MRLLRSCCCGCTLRTGTITIGSLSLIAVTAYLVIIISMIVNVQNSDDSKVKNGIKIGFSSDPSSFSFNSESGSSTDDLNNSVNDLVSNENTSKIYSDYLKSFTTELLSVCAVGAAISVITSILLLIGAAKGYMWLLLPWVANVSLGLIAYFVSSIYQLVKLSEVMTAGGMFLTMLIMFGVLVLDFYLLMVVISHFEELRKNKQEEGSNIGKIYSAPGPWSSSTTNIIPNIPEKEGA